MKNKIVAKSILPLLLGIVSLNAIQNKEVNGEEYIRKRLRLYSEITPLQKNWISLHDEFLKIDSIYKEVDWGEMNEKAKNLLDQDINFYKHWVEDYERIFKEFGANERKKLEPFLAKSFIYTDVVNRAIIKLVYIINHLYKMSLDPSSWTAKEYLEEYNKYSDLYHEYLNEGKKMNEEMDKLKNIKIKIK
jgi:hypothetical protein